MLFPQQFKEWLLLEKFQTYGSTMCLECHKYLMAVRPVLNPSHIYEIGQIWDCDCKKSKLWTNSIRSPEALIKFLDGEIKDYHQGFCNDLYCGHCVGQGRHYLYPMKNANMHLWPHSDISATIYGCEHCKRETIALDAHQELGETETKPIRDWYKRMRKYWEALI